MPRRLHHRAARRPVRARVWGAILAGLGCATVGCSADDAQQSSSAEQPPARCETDTDCAGSPETPVCEPSTGDCVALPPGHEIGRSDGSPGSVALTVIYEPDKLRAPSDLAFDSDTARRLWVVNHGDDSVIIIDSPGLPEMTAERRHDPDAIHFMHHPPALAFGATSPQWGPTFGTCTDDDNGESNPDDPQFTGPALFSANLEIFAKQTPGGLGSHIDMLHSTIDCRGIAHLDANVYFVFNAAKGSLDRYDFHQDHGPGNDDHSDGEIYRYVTGAVKGVDGIPSHVIFDPADAELYVADTGNQRVAKLDTTSGTVGEPIPGEEELVARSIMDGATIVDFVPPGTLQAPSGIEIRGELVFVTDNATSRFLAFDRDGQLVRQLDTGLPPGSLAGFAFGPEDGKVYFTSLVDGRVYRIDPL